MIKLETIEQAVAGEFSLVPDVLRSARQNHDVVQARQICWFIASQAGRSSSWLADRYRKDHTTIGDGIRRVACTMKKSARINDVVVRLCASLLGQDLTATASTSERSLLATRIDAELSRIAAELSAIGVSPRLRSLPQVPEAVPSLASRQTRAGEHRKPIHRGWQTRSCMSCGKPFSSEGAHNRMCQSCRAEGPDLVSVYGG